MGNTPLNPKSYASQGPPVDILVSGGAMVLLSLIYTVLVEIFISSKKDYSPGLGKAIDVLDLIFFAVFGIFIFFLVKLIVGDELRTGMGMAAFGAAILTAVFMFMAAVWNIALVFQPMTPKVFCRGFKGLAALALGASLFLLSRLILKRKPSSRLGVLVFSFACITLALFTLTGLVFLFDAITVSSEWLTIAMVEGAGYVSFGVLFVLLSIYMSGQDISSKFKKPALVASIVNAGLLFTVKTLYLIWIFSDYTVGRISYLRFYGISLIALSVMLFLFSMLTVANRGQVSK